MSPTSTPSNKALVVLSGGADSAICLHWAIKEFDEVQTITFDYGQRHRIELESAKAICKALNIPNKCVPISSLIHLGKNALTDDAMVIEDQQGDDLPNTFVPGRNIIFLTLAGAWCYQLNYHHLVTGVCQTDYSGYPDCRESTMQSLEQSLNLGMESQIKIHTPLMHLSKAESIKMAHNLGAFPSLALSHTCYEGQHPPCGKCPSCVLRQKGFEEAGFKDPLLDRGTS